MTIQRATQHSLPSTNLADLLERILDKGIVIAGDIKIKLVDVELLTIQIRLLICSVDKAREIGIDWWTNNPAFRSSPPQEGLQDHIAELENRMARMEAAYVKAPGAAE
jgi:hypothetical protein